jgi:hypothetical protein
MSGDTQSRHCRWLMLVVSLAHIADTGSGYVGHNRTVLSQLPDTMRWPSGLNATLDTTSPCREYDGTCRFYSGSSAQHCLGALGGLGHAEP